MTSPTSRDRLTGLVATATILAVIAGIPTVLLAIGANPLTWTLPAWDQIPTALARPDDGTLALTAVTVLAWLAWAFLTLTLALEVAARARGVHALRLPGLALPQSAARGLVGAAVLLFTATPTLAASHASAATLTTVHATTRTTATPAPPASPAHATASSRQAPADSPIPGSHTVTDGESLWSIAADELGDGHRWPELAHLNPGAVHGPNHVIYTDTVLHLPSTRHNASAGQERTYTVRTGDTLCGIAGDLLGDPDRYPEIFQASRHMLQPDGRHLSDPDLIIPGWQLTIPGIARPAARPQDHPRPDVAREVPQGPETGDTPDDQDPATVPDPVPASPDEAVTGPAAPHAAPATSSTVAEGPPEVADREAPPAWLLAGLAGGTVLAGSAWLMLRRRRAVQFRRRRPGRTITTPPPVLAPVEKTLTVLGPDALALGEFLDLALRHLASTRTRAAAPMPALAAVELANHAVTVHLEAPDDLPDPWRDLGGRTRWLLATGTDPAILGDLTPDQPAPYPLLATIGIGDAGQSWLFNCEDLTLTVTGDHTDAADFARYLAAELACNPWASGVTIDCVGIAAEAAPINPDRVRVHPADSIDAAAQEALADAVALIDRAGDHDDDAVTARAHIAGADTWPARVLLIDSTGEYGPALTQLTDLLHAHPGATGTSVVLATPDHPLPAGIVLELTDNGRIRLPHAGLDLVAVGLTSDETQGIAALLSAGTDPADTPVPADPTATDGWRAYTDAAGALRPEHTIPRDTPTEHVLGDSSTTLPGPDETYLPVAATTTDDLATLAPRVTATVRDQVEHADPDLDTDLDAWSAPDCDLPRLTLLGPVQLRCRGTTQPQRKAYMTGVLACIAAHHGGITPDELAETLHLSPQKTRAYVQTVRQWLGTNPRTGTPHLPDARHAPAAQARGVAVYQVQDLLVDADLFRRLRARGQARGDRGTSDLARALSLVQGRPYDHTEAGAWTWLYEGDRDDHHLAAAIVDVAHIVTTQALTNGDTRTALLAAQTALLAAPEEEIPHLDLAAVAKSEGRNGDAHRILREQVLTRTDDDEPPTDLSPRTEAIVMHHGWNRPDSRTG